MSKDIIQKSIKCLAKAKLETTYAVARDIVLDELINLQQIEKDHQKLNGELRKEIEKLENDKRGMLVQLYKANQRSEYLQRSCERKEEQMLDYRQEYMEQEYYKSRIDKAKECIIKIRRSPSYELDERIDELQEILDKEIK